MGIGLVILVWLFLGLLSAGIVSLAARCFVSSMMKRLQYEVNHKRVLDAAIRFPFLCLAWVAIIFAFQAFVNESILQRSCGLGDYYRCPLSNGYALSGIDCVNRMRLYNPTTLPEGDGSIDDRSDAVNDVTMIHLAGPLILGATNSSITNGEAPGYADGYFILDTRVGTLKKYVAEFEFLRDTKGLGISQSLQPIEAVYYQNRYTCFDLFALLLGIIPPTYYLWKLISCIGQQYCTVHGYEFNSNGKFWT